IDQGNFLSEARAHAEAAAALERGRAVGERLVEIDPASADNRWLFSKCLSAPAWERVLAGRFEDGVAPARAANALREELVRGEPGNLMWQRDLNASQDRLGTLLMQAGHLDEARVYLQAELDGSIRLSAADPANADLRRGLGVAEERLGTLEQLA